MSSTLKLKLKEAKDKISQQEVEAENQEKALKKVTNELHECKEQLASSEERIEKLESALDDLKGKVNVRKKSASSQVNYGIIEGTGVWEVMHRVLLDWKLLLLKEDGIFKLSCITFSTGSSEQIRRRFDLCSAGQ